MAGEHAAEERARTGSAHLVLAEVGDLDRADPFAHRAHFVGDVGVAAIAAERRLFVCVGRIVCEPERVLEPERRAHHRAACHEPVVQRGGLLPPSLRQGFVREGHHEAAFVVLRGLHRAPVGRREVAKARDVHRPDVDRRLALDHPLGEAEADAARLAEAGHHADRGPVVGHAGYRSDHRVAVRAERERAVDDGLDARAAECGDATEREFEPVGDAVEVGRQQFVTEVLRRAVHLPGCGLRLIGAEQHAVALLAEVDVRLVVDAGRQSLARLHPLDDLRDVLGDQVVVLHRLYRQVHAGQPARFARP